MLDLDPPCELFLPWLLDRGFLDLFYWLCNSMESVCGPPTLPSCLPCDYMMSIEFTFFLSASLDSEPAF